MSERASGPARKERHGSGTRRGCRRRDRRFEGHGAGDGDVPCRRTARASASWRAVSRRSTRRSRRCGRPGSPDAFGLSVDLGDAAAIAAAFRAVGERWGELNCLVNTIGPHAGHFFELTDDDFFAHFNIGTMSAVRCIRAALPLLRKAAWARIVNVSAHSTKRQAPGLISYTAAKSALTSISKNLAKTLAPDNILVNTVSPGTFLSAAFTENLRPVLEPLGHRSRGSGRREPVDRRELRLAARSRPFRTGR